MYLGEILADVQGHWEGINWGAKELPYCNRGAAELGGFVAVLSLGSCYSSKLCLRLCRFLKLGIF